MENSFPRWFGPTRRVMFSFGAFATRANCRAFNRQCRLIGRRSQTDVHELGKVLNRVAALRFIQIAGRTAAA
jgi:hypothetical protein